MLDAGYHSKENLEQAERQGMDCYVPSRKWEDEVQQVREETSVDVEVAERKATGKAEPDVEPIDAVGRMAAKLQTEKGKEIYRKRKKIIEPVFGQLKFNLGLVRFRLKGLKKGRWRVGIRLLGA